MKYMGNETSAWEPLENIENIDKNIETNKNKNGINNYDLISICVPYNGDWSPEWIENIYVKLKYIPVNWARKLTLFCKVPSLPVARDILITEALKANSDYILFLDTDHVLENPTDSNEALKILYQCINKDKDSSHLDYKSGKIVSGLYRAKQKIGFNYAMWLRHYEDNKLKGYLPIKDWNGNWLNVNVTGMGFCLIDANIFKEIPKPWFHWEIAEDISEDFYFFEKAKQYGYDTHVFTDVKLSHIGKLKVKVDGTITMTDL